MFDSTIVARRFFMRPLAAMLFAAAMASFAHAAPYTWTTSGSGSVLTDGAGTWNTSALNWTTTGAGAAVSWPNVTTDIAVFGVGSGAAGTVTVGSVSTNGITFNQPGSGTYLLSGGTISLGGTTPTVTANANATIGSTLTLSGTVLTKAGNGTLTLSGSNSFTGGTTVSAGGLVVSGTTGGGNVTVNASTSTTTVDIASGGRLNAGNLSLKFLAGTGTAAMTVSAGGYLGGANPSLGRNSGVGTLTVNGGTASLTGNSTLGLRFGAGIVTLNSGVYTATGTTQVGSTVVVSSSGTSRGTFTVAGGTATLGGLAIAGGVLNSVVNEFAVGTVNLSGAGVLTVSNTIQVADASRSTAAINVSGGTLNAPGIALLPGTYGDTNSSASVNVTGGSVFLGSGGITRTGTNGTASVALSGGTIGASADWASAVPMTLSNDNGGVTVRAADAASVARNITLSGTLSGTGGLTKTGAGTLTLSGNNTYSGQTLVSAGVLALGATDAISNQSNLLVDGGGFNLAGFNDTVGTVTLTSGSIFGSGTLAGSSYALQGGALNASLSSGAITVSTGTTTLGSAGRFNSASGLTISSGQLTLGGNETVGSFVLTGGILDGSGNTLTSGSAYDVQSGSVLANLGGSVGLTKSTAGTVTLSGNNNYSGQTRVSAGVLALGAANAISNQSNLLVDGGGFNLGGFNDTLSAVTLTSGSIFGSGTLTSSSLYDMQAGTVSAILSGSVGLRKSGSGRVLLSGNNSFTGTTLVEAGSLIVNGALAGDVVVSAGAMLGGAGVLGKTLSGAGTISVGNSPGIGDAGAVDPILGTDWNFEITGTAPTWAAGTSTSVNDVLRLTDATPFLSSLSSGNVVNVLFNIGATPIEQGSYLGGFFIDNESFNLAAALADGTFRYWVAGQYGTEAQRQQFNVGADGAPVWYSLLAAYDPSLTASYTISQQTVNFGGGDVTGAVTQFIVVPEPGAVIVAGIGITMAAWSLRKRRRITRD